MEEFDHLREICNKLHGPKGCPWSKEQTFQSLRPYLLEETHELLEAIDEDDPDKMVEELGDLLFEIIFYAKLGEMRGCFTLEDVIRSVSEKLVRRHAHVFGELSIENVTEVADHWERVKKLEKPERKHVFEGIPKTLGALARAQKIIEEMGRQAIPLPKTEDHNSREEVLGDQFIHLIKQACQEKCDAESVVRKALKKCEAACIDSDKNGSHE